MLTAKDLKEFQKELEAFFNSTKHIPRGAYVHLPEDKDEVVCECGSDKLGHPGHDSWCKKGIALSSVVR